MCSLSHTQIEQNTRRYYNSVFVALCVTSFIRVLVIFVIYVSNEYIKLAHITFDFAAADKLNNKRKIIYIYIYT